MLRGVLVGLALALSWLTCSNAGARGEGRFQKWLLGSDAAAAPSVNVNLDEASRRCVDCHDGTRAKQAGFRAIGTEPSIGSADLGSHSVGARYATSASLRPRQYEQEARLDPRLTLIDGRVACVTCHALRAGSSSDESIDAEASCECTASGELAIPEGGAALCTSCHLLL